MSEKSITFNPTPEALAALVAQLRNKSAHLVAHGWSLDYAQVMEQAADALESLAADWARLARSLQTISNEAWPISDPLGVEGGTVRAQINRIEKLRVIAVEALRQIDAAQKGDK